MREAKMQLSHLEFIIARDGRPVARVVPIRDEIPAARIGFLPEITVPDDFDEMGANTIAGNIRNTVTTYLLDTHALLRVAQDSPLLSARAREIGAIPRMTF